MYLWQCWESHTLLWFNFSVGSEKIYVIVKIVVSISVLIYCISVMLTANIMVIDLITNTFDFWFKVVSDVQVKNHTTHHFSIQFLT